MRILFRRTPPIFILTCLLALSVLFSSATATSGPPARIVSMAPSTTEILFALGLGDKVIGVTRYCDYPEAAKNIAKVGGYVDPSYEAILALKPDMVILLTSHQDAERELTKLKIPTLTIPHETVSGIHEAIRRIGAACGVEEKAAAILDSLEQRTEAVRKAVKDRPKPRVLVCIGRDTESGQLVGMYFAGQNGFYDEIIEMAGGVNAYQDATVAYPQLSAEGVVQLNPDVIVDLASHINPEGKTATQIAAQWDALRSVSAVRDKRIHVVVGNHALRPGPRYAEFLEELARLLHPECFAKEAARE
jgi:iron complex transport system substrate-binding protein